MKYDLIIINTIWFYLKNKNIHKWYTIRFNILFNVHESKLKNNWIIK